MTHPGWISEDSSLFQGDIFGIEVRNAITGKNFRWPDATIPYVITTSFSILDLCYGIVLFDNLAIFSNRCR